MKPASTTITTVVAVLLVVVLSGMEANAQNRVSWIGTAGTESPWNAGDAGNGEGTNWRSSQGANFQPDRSNPFVEYGSISNGGIALIDSAISVSPLDILLAEDAGSTGGLVIQDGGGITVAKTEVGVDVFRGNGALGNGYGYNSADPDPDNWVLESRGTAAVTLHDAMGAVNVESYLQNSVSTLNLDIGGTTFNPVTVSEQITLDGILQVSGALASAGATSSWTVFDGTAGGAAVNGQFNQIVNNSDHVFLPGQSFTVSTANNSVTLGIQQQLALLVDPFAGTAVLSNPAGSGVDFDLTGYVMSVTNGTVNGSQWVSFTDDGVANFDETARAAQLGETSPTSMVGLPSGTDKDFGAPLDIDTNQPLGTNLLDSVSFQFSAPDGQIADALIVREGNRQNNVVLVVDPTDGSCANQNQSTQDVDLTGYVIESDSGALLATWDDLEDQGVPGWEVVADTSNALAELNAENMSMLGAGDMLDLGSLWDLSQQDLSLQFSMLGGETAMDGVVFYGDPADIGGEEIIGDYNDSGQVEQGDLDLVLLNWGADVPPTPAGWVNQIPSDEKVDQNDLDSVLLNWGNTAAVSTASVVPEPASLWMVAMGMAGCLILRSRRGASKRAC